MGGWVKYRVGEGEAEKAVRRGTELLQEAY